MEEFFIDIARFVLIVIGFGFMVAFVVGAGHCLYIVLSIISGLADRVLRILERKLR